MLPASLGDALRPALPALADEVVAVIGREVDDYARPLEGPFGHALRGGVERALERFVDRIEHPAEEDAGARELYVALGRGEFRAGRSLDALLSAYRIGARVAWERFVDAGQAAGHDPATLYRLAGAIFDYIDRVSAESVEGYAQERATAEGERQRARRALARALARDDATLEEVQEAAREAGWTRPGALAALVVPGEGDADRLASRLGDGVIAVADDHHAVAWVPDPRAPLRQAQLAAALGERTAALGPAVVIGLATRSLNRARAVLGLVDGGRLPPGCLLAADDHLAALLLHAGDASAGVDLAERALEPLADLRPAARERLRATLQAWLDRPGQVQEIGRRLHVHPQTVRYRVAQLRELFGDRLDDTEARFELALALRVEAPPRAAE
jgi:hypothetical protein